MPDPTPTPPSPRAAFRPVLTAFLKYVLPALVAALLGYFGAPATVVEKVTEVPFVVGTKAEEAADFGWKAPTPEQVADALDPAKTTQFALTPAGKAVQGDEDVFLYQPVLKYSPRGPPWLNQKDVGCCVGCGSTHAAMVCEAVQVAASNGALEFRPLSVEVIYAGSRNEIGGGQIRGDGSVGAWAAKFLTTYGAAEAKKYETVDLTTFSPARAREMARPGARLPADVVAAAKSNPVKSAALVRSWDDVARSIRQGYPVMVCSNVGFAGMRRDGDGFCPASGTWNHCMSILAVRGGKRPGAFVLNNWGPDAHTGPVWPPDAPTWGFWAEPATIERMVRQADSYALSDMAGFPSRALPFWFIRAPRQEPAFALRAPDFLRGRVPVTRRANGPVLVEPASVAW